MPEPTSPPQLRFPVFTPGTGTPSADDFNKPLQSWAAEVNAWLANQATGRAEHPELDEPMCGTTGTYHESIFVCDLPEGHLGSHSQCDKAGRVEAIWPRIKTRPAERLPCGHDTTFASAIVGGKVWCVECDMKVGPEQIRGPLPGEEWPPMFEQSQRPEWLPDDAVIRLVNDIQALVLIPRDADKVLDLITRWYNESNPRKRLLDARAERDKAVRALVVCDGTASDQLAALEGERDKAIQERDAAIKRAEHAAIQGSIYERASDNETQRAEAAEAKVADLEAKLHFDEEAGMDNVRRMERAEAKVTRVEVLLVHLGTRPSLQTTWRDFSQKLTKALDGEPASKVLECTCDHPATAHGDDGCQGAGCLCRWYP